MVDPRIQTRLESIAGRLRVKHFCLTLMFGWGGIALIGLIYVVLLLTHSLRWPWATLALGSAALLVVMAAIFVRWRSARDLRHVARLIETAHPDLKSRLLAAMEQEPELPHGRFGFLQESVIREAVVHAKLHRWFSPTMQRRVTRSKLASVIAFMLLVGVVTSVMVFESTATPGLIFNPFLGWQVVPDDSFTYHVTVEPGDTEVERGNSLLVLARFSGPLPPEAVLNMTDEQGNAWQLPMSRSLDDPLFAARIESIDGPLTYRVDYAHQQTDSYDVHVFEYPELRRADATLEFPQYTSLPQKTVEDVRRVTAVEGTELTLTFELNKPVTDGRLTDDKGDPIPLIPAAGAKPAVYTATMTLNKSRRLKLQLTDDWDRHNKSPAEFVLNVTPNRPPDLKIVQPKRDVQVSPLEELRLAASAWDDFGLEKLGLTYSMAGQEPKDVVLSESRKAKERFQADYLLALEDMKAQPDELVSYHFWAEDIGPEGSRRRTLSDMFFAEVRHFDEIFRQGQQPSSSSQEQQQQQQNSENENQAEQLAELQKQIINATWKIIRREIGKQPSAKFKPDVTTVKDSQQTALEKTAALAEKVEDAESLAHVDIVQQAMNQALEHLTNATENADREALTSALSAEQLAYQALLKLRAREHQVTQRSQRSSRSSSSSARNSSSRFQQQLQQLELENSENRYETQRDASQQRQETEADRENRQVLNRLRELARRQEDLNKRIKELQSQLEEAKSEKEREEIQRQLKRLRDEEQRILRDTDELRNRMDEPQNQEQMADAREQLDQTRENVRRASESLEKGMTSRAAAAGSRAERELKELREEFRKRTARQFEDEMKQMRDDARQLAENERQIGQKLQDIQQPKTKSLRSSDEREAVRDKLNEQQEQLDSLFDRMETTVQEADESEPLLAQQLYDTLRETRQSDLNDAWDATDELIRRGLLDDARRAEQVAQKRVDELQQGIERAAESVLGNELETLRRALSEVKQLQEQLDREIAAADPKDSGASQRQQQGESQNKDNGQRAGTQSQQSREQSPSDQNGQPRRSSDQASSDQRQQSGDGQQQRNEQQQSNERSQRQSSQNQQSSGNQESQPNQQPGRQSGQQPGQQPGTRRESNNQSERQATPNQDGSQQRPSRQGPPRLDQPRDTQNAATDGLGGFQRFFDSAQMLRAPLTGDGFRDWSDRLREIEEMVDDPELRSKAARIRERARDVRIDVKRHSKQPNWDLVRMSIARPLTELRNRIAEEVLRRQSEDALVPIDRDPVPNRFAESVRKYYERLGSGE